MGFSVFIFEKLLEDFLFNSLNLWFRCLQKHKKESYIYLSSQLFFKTPNKTLKF